MVLGGGLLLVPASLRRRRSDLEHLAVLGSYWGDLRADRVLAVIVPDHAPRGSPIIPVGDFVLASHVGCIAIACS